MDDIFEKELEKASEEITNTGGSTEGHVDLPSDLQEQLDTVNSLIGMSPDVVESDEYKDLMARISDFESGQANEDNEDEDEDEEDSEDEDSEDDEDSEGTDDNIETDVFGTLSKGKKKKAAKLDFDVPDGMNELISSRYGTEDAATFFGSVDTWRTQAQEGAEAKNQLEALSNDIQNLPPDLRSSISKWADGEDYTAPFTDGQRLDFGSDFNEQDIESLVEHYFPEEYDRLIASLEDEDGIDEAEFEDKLGLLGRSTKKQFTAEKKTMVDGRVQFEERQENLLQQQKESALDSVDNLSKSYPNFSKSELGKVRNILVNGNVDSLFYDSDGSYLEGAAEMVANALYGSKMQETIKTLAKRQGRSEANQQIVDTSSKSVRKQKSSNSKAGLNTSAAGHLSSAFETDPYA